MYRMTSLISGLVMALATLALAQQPELKQEIPENVFGTRDLVAWTSMQEPHPTPQPAPPRDNPIPEPGQQADQQAKTLVEPQNPASPIQSFTGRIVKEGAEYVLKGNATYRLDEQTDASKYENQDVNVAGNLAPGSTRIHVVNIVRLS